MDYEYTVYVDYVSTKGGVNNLQIAKVVCSNDKGSETIKTFRSYKDLAQSKAEAYARKLRLKAQLK